MAPYELLNIINSVLLWSIEGHDLTTDCWPYFQLTATRGKRIQPEYGMMCGKHVNRQGYLYKSLAAQIVHNAVLAGWIEPAPCP